MAGDEVPDHHLVLINLSPQPDDDPVQGLLGGWFCLHHLLLQDGPDLLNGPDIGHLWSLFVMGDPARKDWAGLQGLWTAQQGWDLSPCPAPPWHDDTLSPDAPFQALWKEVGE